MDAERFARLEGLFAEALAQPPERRDAWIESRCGDDAGVLGQLRAMLAVHDDEISDPFAAAVARSTEAAGSPLVGRRIGSYRILSELGRGGMGTVYEAQREGTDFEQRVAIKLLRLGLRDPVSLARFSRERQLLARLSHPNIASLIDGGTAEDGTPWVAMELVRGQPIDDYAARKSLSLRARIALFVRLCDAVGHAHHNLVVHRDLKPDNVIVDDSGEPKVLDFGIAKLLDDDAEGTATLARAFTPSHASPEQVRGDPITPACDVYALGVMLYELCTGQSPYEGEVSRRNDWERAICEQMPVRPGSRSAPVRGDLDHIILKALRKEPERRYRSAHELAADLRRYLEDRPVHARPDRLTYRANKYVTRHPWGVAAGVIIAVLVLAFLANTLIQSRRIAEERDRAVREAAIARETTSFMVDLFQAPDPKRNRTEVTATDLLERGAERIDELEADPLVLARLLHEIGMAFGNLGRYEQGVPLLKRALEIRLKESGESPETADTRNRLGDILRDAGRYREAEPFVVAALEYRVASGEGDNPDLADSYNNVGLLQRDLGEYARAATNLETSIAMHRRLDPDSHGLAVAQHNLALVRLEQDQPEAAMGLLTSALAIKHRGGQAESSTYANSESALARAYLASGQWREALDAATASLALRRRVLPADHPRIAAGLSGLAAIHAARGELEPAGEHYRRAVEIAAQAYGEETWNALRYRVELARLWEAQGDIGDAVAVYRRALAAAQSTFEPDSPHIAEINLDLGRALLASGAVDQARPFLQRAAAIRGALFGPDHPATAESSVLLAAADGEFPELPQRLAEDVRLPRQLLRKALAGRMPEAVRPASAPRE